MGILENLSYVRKFEYLSEKNMVVRIKSIISIRNWINVLYQSSIRV